MKLEVGKYYRTRDNRKARVICTDKIGFYPVVSLMFHDDKTELVLMYSKTGLFVKGVKNPEDLVAPWVDEPKKTSKKEKKK